MRLTKLLPLVALLGLVLVYDPNHTDAQFGKRDGGGGPGGFTPGGGAAPGGFGQPGGGPPGGFGRGGSGGFKMDPEMGWNMMVRVTQSTGDTIDLSKINPQMREFSRSRAERDGSIPLPDSGVMTKAQYFDHFARSEAAKAAKAAAGGAPGGPTGPGGAMVVTLGPGGPAPGGPMTFNMAPGGMPGGPGGFGGQGGPGGVNVDERATQRLKEQDKDGDGRVSFAEADGRLKENFTLIDKNGDGFVGLDEYKGYYASRNNPGGQGGPGGNFNGGNFNGGNGNPDFNGGNFGNRDRRDDKKDSQELKPVAMRYGHLPKDLPEWFDKYDGDKDGQVALHEWRKAGDEIAKFQEMDLNGDGLITADELLRFNLKQTEDAKIAVLNGEAGAFSRPSLAGNGRGGSSGGFSLPGSTPSDKVSTTGGSSDKDKMSSRFGEKDRGSSSTSGSSDKDKSSSDKPNPFRDGGGFGKKVRN